MSLIMSTIGMLLFEAKVGMPLSKKLSSRKRDYRRNKLAFDSVLSHMKRIGRPWMSPSRALDMANIGSGGSRNPAKPNTVEFWADAFIAIRSACPRDINMVTFHLAYTLFDSEDVIEQEKHADKLLGGRRHSVEQRVGEDFIRRKIYPVQSRGYFFSERKPTRSCV
jgi:hypothetical protein